MGPSPEALEYDFTSKQLNQYVRCLISGEVDEPQSLSGKSQGQFREPNWEEMSDAMSDAMSEFADQRAHQRALNGTSTPPINIAMTPSMSRSISMSRVASRNKLDLPDPTPRAAITSGKIGRKKKKTKKVVVATALTTVRGFAPTPTASGDEDSDFSLESFKRQDISVASSPGLRPTSSCGGISALRQQLDMLNLQGDSVQSSPVRNQSKLRSETPSSASVTSDTMSDRGLTDMTSYEIPLDHDFISRDAQEEIGDSAAVDSVDDVVTRKMTASDFQPLSCLGKGTYGTVILVKHAATGRLYAQKQFRKASLKIHRGLIEQTKTERAILESVNRYPFVVKLYYAFQDHEKLYLILEYAQGGELFTHLATDRMFPEETAAFYMAEMVLALEHLHHTVGVIYRDLKPENCLLDSEGHLLLTDFGLSKVAVEGEECRSILGTLEYMAPEVILGHHYGMAVDWWSFGALGVDLLTGSPPFQGSSRTKIGERIVKQKLSLPYYLSLDAKDLLTRLLRKEPHKRLGASMPKDMHAIKKHRFFRKIDWTRLEKREVEPPIKPLITDPALAENFSKDFTDLAVSPVRTYHEWVPGAVGEEANPFTMGGKKADPFVTGEEANPFGGFSFVASRSVLELGHGFY